MKRRFNARISRDKGVTWHKARATGWPVTELRASLPEDMHGYVVALDSGDILVDVEIPERAYRLIGKDIEKKKLFDDNEGEKDD